MDNSSFFLEYIGWLEIKIVISHSSACCEDYFHKSETPEVRISLALRVILTCENEPHDLERSKFECIYTNKFYNNEIFREYIIKKIPITQETVQ